MTPPPLVLASASAARKRLLAAAGFQPIICPSDFDESTVQVTDPGVLVRTLAQGKAGAVAPQFSQSLILGCDSILVLQDQIYGKPESPTEAIARWHQMRGQVGQLYTGHALVDQTQHKTLVRCQITQVHFAEVSDRQIAAYVATGEPLYCAGSFALEGRGSLFIEKIEGCHTNVIGLSLPLLRQMLQELGYDATDFWSAG
jgi:septum formation protein